MVWSAQQLQFVLFTAPKPGQPDALQPWLKLFKSTPQNYQQSGPGAPQPTASASGVIGNFNVTVGAAPGRFDIILTSSDNTAEPDRPPLISDIEAGLGSLVAHATKFLEFEPSIRLALVTNLSEPVADLAASADKFRQLAGGLDFPPGATDLALQLNVRKTDPESGREVNRLCRWQTQLLQSFVVHFDGAFGQGAPIVKSTHAIGATFDINTVPSQAQFERDEALAVVKFLEAETSRVISGGYEYVTN